MASTENITTPTNIYSGFLSFADDTSWSISGFDKNSIKIVSHLAKAMKLKPCPASPNKDLFVYTKSETTTKKNKLKPLLEKSSKEKLSKAYFCEVDYASNRDIMALQLMEIASVIRQNVEVNMGFLIHGALAEYNGKGIILTGPGGIGKTTASKRLPDPWKSLSDDTTLIVRDKSGNYLAHPWPTWSRFMFGDTGGTWDVSRSIPVAGVYFLKRNNLEKSVGLSREEAVCRLVQSAEEALLPITQRTDRYDPRDMRVKRFDNICAFSKSVKCRTLSFTQTGTFWKEIEKDLLRSHGTT